MELWGEGEGKSVCSLQVILVLRPFRLIVSSHSQLKHKACDVSTCSGTSLQPDASLKSSIASKAWSRPSDPQRAQSHREGPSPVLKGRVPQIPPSPQAYLLGAKPRPKSQAELREPELALKGLPLAWKS